MLDFKDYETYLNSIMTNKDTEMALLCNVKDSTYVVYPKDENSTDTFGLPVIHSLHQGGTLVLFNNDITFTWLSSTNKLPEISTDIIEFLINQKLPIELDNNDVCVKGRKLFGTMSYQIEDGRWYSGMFFSFNTDVDVIKQVCKKPMKKTPISMPLQITPTMIKQLCLELCEKYNLKIYGGEE